MTGWQIGTFNNIKVRRGERIKVELIPKSKLPYYAKQESLDNFGWVYVKSEGPHATTGQNTYVFEEISNAGVRYELMYGSGTIPTDPTPRELAMDRATGVDMRSKKERMQGKG